MEDPSRNKHCTVLGPLVSYKENSVVNTYPGNIPIEILSNNHWPILLLVRFSSLVKSFKVRPGAYQQGNVRCKGSGLTHNYYKVTNTQAY